MNNMPKKRTNPFAKPITPEKEEQLEEIVEKPIVEPEVIEEEPEIEEYVELVINGFRGSLNLSNKEINRNNLAGMFFLYIFNVQIERCFFTSEI